MERGETIQVRGLQIWKHSLWWKPKVYSADTKGRLPFVENVPTQVPDWSTFMQIKNSNSCNSGQNAQCWLVNIYFGCSLWRSFDWSMEIQMRIYLHDFNWMGQVSVKDKTRNSLIRVGSDCRKLKAPSVASPHTEMQSAWEASVRNDC